MLVAELRRKLPDVRDIDPGSGDPVARVRALLKESSEDVLTSDVFGSLKYLPRRPYLEAILRLIAERNPRALAFRQALPTLLDELESVEFLFWRSYPTPKGIGDDGNTEPDVVLSTPGVFLVIEAKLGSGFGTQQIERELAVALDQAGTSRQPFLLLVTTSLSAPPFGPRHERWTFEQYVDDRVANDELPKDLACRLKQAAERVLWVDWAGIITALKQAGAASPQSGDPSHAFRARDLVNDLVAVTEMRGIRMFEGLRVFDKQPSAGIRPVLVSADVSNAAQETDDEPGALRHGFEWGELAMRHDWSQPVQLVLRKRR